MSMTQKWCDYEIARDAFFTNDISNETFAAMDHADVVTWHGLAREAERSELNAMRVEVRFGIRPSEEF